MKPFVKWLFLPIPLLLLPFFFLFPDFAEGFSTTVAAFFRLLFGGVASLFPFSLFEMLIALFALFVAALLLALPFAAKNKKRLGKIGKGLVAALLVLVLVLDLFALTFASSYYRHSLADLMALDTAAVDEESVFLALSSLCDLVNESAPRLSKGCLQGLRRLRGRKRLFPEKRLQGENLPFLKAYDLHPHFGYFRLFHGRSLCEHQLSPFHRNRIGGPRKLSRPRHRP